MPLKKGSRVFVDVGFLGEVKAVNKFKPEEDADGNTIEHADQFLVTWTDKQGDTAEHWFEESALTAI